MPQWWIPPPVSQALIFLAVRGLCWTASAQDKVPAKPPCTSGGWRSNRTARVLSISPDHEPHCGLLPANHVRRWTDDSTWGWRRCCQLAEFWGAYSTHEIVIIHVDVKQSRLHSLDPHDSALQVAYRSVNPLLHRSPMCSTNRHIHRQCHV